MKFGKFKLLLRPIISNECLKINFMRKSSQRKSHSYREKELNFDKEEEYEDDLVEKGLFEDDLYLERRLISIFIDLLLD